MLERLTAEQFAPLLDTVFEVARDGHEPLRLRLAEIGRYPRSGVGYRAEPFSLIFVGDGGELLPQHIYRLEHADLAPLEIFLVPLARAAEGVRYEAVFN